MGIFESFDYRKMAEESERRPNLLKEALEKVKNIHAKDANEELKKRSRIYLLEEEIMEEKVNLNFFRQRAKERSGL